MAGADAHEVRALRRPINSPRYKVPVHGFSQIVAGPAGLLFVSGITSRNSAGEILHEGDILAQCRQVMENLKNVLEDAGSGLGDVLQVRTFVLDLRLASQLDAVWPEYWGDIWPASTLVEVSRLFDTRQLIEIEAIAVRS